MNGFVQTHNAPRHRIFAREGKQLPGQLRCPFRCINNNVGESCCRRGRLGSHLDEFGIRQNDSENVVEVVRNAAGERSDGLHLLGARDLFHQPSPLGHVLDDSGIAAAIGHATQQCNDALIRRGQQLSFEVLHGPRRPHHFDELALDGAGNLSLLARSFEDCLRRLENIRHEE